MAETTKSSATEILRALGVKPSVRWRINFHGEEFLYIGDDDLENGAIATREEYENFEPNFAHLKNGVIQRHHRTIGTRDEIVWLEKDA